MEEKETSEKTAEIKTMLENILLSDSISEDKKVEIFEEVLKILDEEKV